MSHSVNFVSLGPGDPDLVTIKALKILQQVDSIYYPSTTSKSGQIISRSLDILSQLNISKEKLVSFNVPMNKNRTLAIEAYNNVADCIALQHKNGDSIAIVAEGDAGFYSSIHYIYEYLCKRNIPVIQIAGIPAFIACGSLAGIHIVSQEEKLIVLPGIASEENLYEHLKSGKTLVIMKVSQCQDAIKNIINKLPQYKYHYFENVGVPEKEYYTCNLNDILTRTIPYFSLMIIKHDI